jgi:hypothetical protein
MATSRPAATGRSRTTLYENCSRRRPRICHEALVDSVADAPLEAPQRLLWGFALRQLLAVVGSARSVRPVLACGDHVQGVALRCRFPPSESLWRTTFPLEASTGAEWEAKWALVGKRATSPTVPKIVAARMGPMPKIWVRVLPEASTSASMRRFSSAIFLSSIHTSRNISEAKRRRRRAEAPPRSVPS